MRKYFVLHPAVFKLDGGAMFGIIPKPLWSRAIPADEQNRIQLSLRVLLIQTENHNILVDTGIGDYHGKKFDDRFGIQGESNPLVEVLKKDHGLNPEDITDLIVTHLHFDHVGGLGHAQSMLFPKALLHLHRKHWEYALNPTPRDTGSFQKEFFAPIVEELAKKNQVNWLDGNNGEIVAGIKFKCSFGHTPWLVHPYDEKFIYMADLVPTSHHVPVPWVMGYDINPGRTTQDKLEFYALIREKDLTMIFEHDMQFWGGKVSEENVAIDQLPVDGAKSQRVLSPLLPIC
jgi:glyoxylase-like metal-dependent hydrolase (beta-lactamase superfamily II)